MTKKTPDLDLHKGKMIKVLVGIVKEIGKKVVFKGGTCAFLFYDLPRLSLDLDFDTLSPVSQKDLDELKALLRSHGGLADCRDKQFTTFFLLNYQKQAPNIKVEINKREFFGNWRPVWFLGVRMKIVDRATIFSQKFVALTKRKQPVARDLFDVHYFLSLNFPLNEKVVRKRTGLSVPEYLRSSIPFVEKNYTEKNILFGLGELLEKEQKKWAKRNLKKETISLLEERIKKIENK